MPPIAERLADDRVAAATSLCSTARVHRDCPLASVFSFTGKTVDELVPSGVVDGLCEVTPDHTFDVKVLIGNEFELVVERTSELAGMVYSLVNNMGVAFSNEDTSAGS